MSRSILQKWYFRTFHNADLRAYEAACLEAWRAQLSIAASTILANQLERYDLVQRQSDDKLTCFYCLENPSCSSWPESALFPLHLEEATVARIELQSTNAMKKVSIQCEVNLFQGRFFSLTFSKSPKALVGGVKVVDAKGLLDPMKPVPATGPRSTEQDEALVAAIDVGLPNEYRELLGPGAPETLNQWDIHDLAHVRKVAQADRNYYWLAEKAGLGAVAVADQDRSGNLYFLGIEDDRPTRIDTSLRAFLETH